MTRRLLGYVTFAMGLVGAIACVAAIVAVWSLTARTRQATQAVFARVDGALVVVQERTEQAADRVRASAITTRSVADGLREWTRQQARQEIAKRLQLAEHSDQLRLALQQADDWLELSESSARLAQQALSLGNSLGAPIDTRPVDAVIEEIVSLRSELGDATQLVQNLHERAAALAAGQVPAGRVEQAVRLAARVAANLSSIDARLDRLGRRLSEAQQSVEHLQGRALSWIQLTTIVVTLLIAWMAAGQAALCYIAWKSLPSTGGADRTRQPDS